MNNNRFSDLDEGVRLLDASGRYLAGTVVQNNLFERCPKGIVLPGQNAALLSPVIGCNTLMDVDHGIEIEPGARVGNFGNSGAPVSNDYRGAWAETVHNDGAAYASDYWFNFSSGSGSTEATVTNNRLPGINYRQDFSGYSCTGTYGLHRSSNGGGLTIDAMQAYIRDRRGDDKENHLMEQQLVRAYEDGGDFDKLRDFVRNLSLPNDQAFGRLSVYLMEYYREQQNEDQATQVARELLTQLDKDPDIQARVAYFEVAGHLQTMAGGLPDDADVEQLNKIIGSGTSFAPVACATLRYYFPDRDCEYQTGGIAVQAARSARGHAPTRKTGNGLRLFAAPNPAQENLLISFQQTGKILPLNGARFQLVALNSGQVMLTLPLPTNGQLTVDVRQVPAGIYVGRVTGEANVSASCKIVVVH